MSTRNWEPGTLVRCIKEFKSIVYPEQDFGQLGKIYVITKYLSVHDYITLCGLEWVDVFSPGLPVLVNASRFEKV